MTTEVATIDQDQERERNRKQALLKAVGLDRVPVEQRELALNIANRYDLDLLLKHVVLIEGRPYLTRDGLLHIAHRSGALDGIEVSDPELVEMSGQGSFWKAECRVYRKDMSRPFRYQGRYPAKGGNQRFAPEMAVKVAEVMALRRAFDVSAPAFEERWDVEAPAEPEPIAPITEVIAAKRAAITSGPPWAEPTGSPRGAAEPPAAGRGGEAAGAATRAADQPYPHPDLGVAPLSGKPDRPVGPVAPPAGARAATQDDPVPGSAEAGPPPPEAHAGAIPKRCEGFSGELGACVREPGHGSNHRNKAGESWG